MTPPPPYRHILALWDGVADVDLNGVSDLAARYEAELSVLVLVEPLILVASEWEPAAMEWALDRERFQWIQKRADDLPRHVHYPLTRVFVRWGPLAPVLDEILAAAVPVDLIALLPRAGGGAHALDHVSCDVLLIR